MIDLLCRLDGNVWRRAWGDWCRCRCGSLSVARDNDGGQDGRVGRRCSRGWCGVVVEVRGAMEMAWGGD